RHRALPGPPRLPRLTLRPLNPTCLRRSTTTFPFNRAGESGSALNSQPLTPNIFRMAKTEVILTSNIIGLGGESDQVKVAAGYARNYLYPQGFAIPLTGANKRRLEVLKQRRAEREAHDLNTMTE